MAMTKKEKAEFDAAILRANTLAALRWTEPVKKDVPLPNPFCETSGFDFNTYNTKVYQAWSTAISHGDGDCRKNSHSASQRGIWLFSTKVLALRAMRHEIECQSAKKLREIDEQIALEIAKNEVDK